MVLLPANLAGSWFLQIRMVLAIALLTGHNPLEERARSMVLLAALGKSGSDALREIAKIAGKEYLERMSAEMITKAVTSAATKHLARKSLASVLSKCIPLVGSATGAAFDAVTTWFIAKVAKSLFVNDHAT